MEALANVAAKKGAGELSDATTEESQRFFGDQWTIKGSSGIYQGILSKSHLRFVMEEINPKV